MRKGRPCLAQGELEDNGEGEHRRKWTHDLFFVRMEWWAFPLAAVAVAMAVTGWRPGDAANTVKAAGQSTQKLVGGK